ncbi:MAG: hypothetical protein GC146_15150 [Limimaricola sp.]|uniref:hypothetical protein n=1 Tax=Limimaricola sp. TaxID=2211665 RepID=UPI001D7BB28B|nr:hypothetical protein [Limimaricola sp.]MBI1418551.1 hypothetical protein [Limimaricola sp.]
MKLRWLWQADRTAGERRAALACAVVAISSASVAVLVRTRLAPGGEGLFSLWGAASGAVGGWVALRLSAHRLGHPGLPGTLRALGGIITISFIAALIAGTMILPGYGTMFGPFSLAMTLIGSPIVAVLWLLGLWLSHKLIATWRHEQESVHRARALAPGWRTRRRSALINYRESSD